MLNLTPTIVGCESLVFSYISEYNIYILCFMLFCLYNLYSRAMTNYR